MTATIMDKMIAIILCAAILLSVLAGCVRKKEDGIQNLPGTDERTELSGLSDEERRTAIYKKAYDTLKPDEVVLKIDGEDVVWKDFFYWMLVSIEFYIENYGEFTDWNASDGKITAGEYIINEAVDVMRLHKAVELKAVEHGITISESDRNYLDSTKSSIVEQYGGREKFLSELEKSFMSEALYDRQNEISVLYYNLFSFFYGENGERASDEDAKEFAEKVGYMRIKNIMLNKTDDNGSELDENTLAEKKALIESILNELLEADESVRKALFDEKMKQYSEDEGLKRYPDGYCFLLGSGELAAELEEPASELEVGEIDREIVESSQGYHIIMRLDVPPDTYMDEYYTLRYYAAYAKFEETVKEWQDSVETKFTEAFLELDFEKIFKGL